MSKLSLEHSDPETDSDATLEDLDLLHFGRCGFGHPLERVPRSETAALGDGVSSSSDQPCCVGTYCSDASCYSGGSEGSDEFSDTSSIVFDIDFEALIDALLARDASVAEAGCLTILEPSSKDVDDSVMIKCLPRTSSELILLLELNHPDIRSDPWNPAPHIMCAVERDDNVYLCIQRLVEFDQPPLKTVANYIDFFRQSLEGLTFLHEHRIAQLSCSDPRSLMVDLGVWPSSMAQFDRMMYPVRYYYFNFSNADRFHSANRTPFQQDVQDCGQMIDRMLVDIPQVGPKLKSLVKAMLSGEFGADDSRKLFEALCKSLESSVFDIMIPVRKLSTGDA